MKVLLDTHALLWFVENDPRLGASALATMVDPANELLLSPATYWELAIKVGLGKYRLSQSLEDYIEEAIRLYHVTVLPIEVRHASVLTTLPHHHRDPFDRLLIAQAIVEQVPVLSADLTFDAYPVSRLW